MPHMLSRSRYDRRLHRVAELVLTLRLPLGEFWKVLNERSSYVLDSYPFLCPCAVWFDCLLPSPHQAVAGPGQFPALARQTRTHVN